MPANSFQTFWTIFGTSNQLLASLTLVGVRVWLARRPVWFALAPGGVHDPQHRHGLVLNFRVFWNKYAVDHAPMTLTNMCIAAVLFLLGGLVVFEALRACGAGVAQRAGDPRDGPDRPRA